MQVATATFDGTQDSVSVTYPTAMLGIYGITHGVTVTDSEGPVSIWITGRTPSGCTINTGARFSGTVELNVFDK